MIQLTDIYEQVERRSGLMARRRGDATIAATEHDRPTLRTFARQGAVEIATKTQRIQGSTHLAVQPGVAAYEVDPSVGVPLEIRLDGRRLPLVAGVRARRDAEARGLVGRPTAAGFYAGAIWLDRQPVAPGTLAVYHTTASLLVRELVTCDLHGADADLHARDVIDLYAGSLDLEASGDVDLHVPGSGTTDLLIRALGDPDLVAYLPPEMERLLADYTLAEWFLALGAYGEQNELRHRYMAGLDELRHDPRAARRGRITYRPFL